MPVAKLLGTGIPDAMKSEEGTDSLDTFIRQAVGKEPLFSFSRTGDSPMQWIQLLHALDQQDLPGWPLLAPMKVQMQKCDKCAREFCSPINYRRHMRVHRRSMNIHKEPQKYRDLLGAFWDKLSYDEAKDIMSFKDVNLEEVPGSSIVRNIAANLRKPVFLSLPQVYVKAGSALVDIVQGRPSRLPISSEELFSLLDDASEKTFLCAGTAESLQKYVFDGEAGKIGLEMKNLIACTSFLAEQKLVKAWLADKDAEALRCQKLLVEEEEAAQRRQAELLERKRQRKIRQKEQRAKDHSNGMKVDLYTASDIFESIPSAETSSSQTSPQVNPLIPDEHVATPLDPSSNEEVVNIEAQGGCSSDHSDTAATEQQKMQENGSQHFIARWQVPKSQRGGRNGFHSNQNGNMIKWEQAQKAREQRVNGSKVWTKKPKFENGGRELVKSRVQNDAIYQTTQTNCQLMIGSISVTVRNCQAEFEEKVDREIKTNSVQNGTNRSTLKFWRPRNDTRGQLAYRGNGQILKENATPENGTLSSENDHQSCDLNGNDIRGTDDSNVQVENSAMPKPMPFSIDAAKAFLAQRWKEAISGDHVKLVLSSVAEQPPGQLDFEENRQVAESEDPMVVGSSKGRLGKVAEIDSTTHTNVKPKFRTKPEKNMKTKYIPKQRAVY
ncbi:uncharacterized protein LOC112529478 isoform X1 [Cynara cardunculus var. scolymus]|uniref:uncharacterized protein LOC112529478 isoform X1 n=1 Tax=Cynara cardunculus var. scolymus TaxID=59895 RepID=UPI000D62867C|nr:uncharacterized protein LOC112529478 isoform X1 [Cynara cardunculus var. scolymus]